MSGRPFALHSFAFRRSAVLVVLILTACSWPIRQTAPAFIQYQAEATQAAFLVQTAIARPPSTPTPLPTPLASPTPTLTPAAPTSAAPTPSLPRVTALPGLEFYSHPHLPNYVFQIDPTRWEQDPDASDAVMELMHTSITGCRVESVLGGGIGQPERHFWQDLGRFRWHIMDYGTWAFAVPTLGAGLAETESGFLRLVGYDRRSCRAAQEEVLSNLLTQREIDGEVAFALFQSPTPRPALEGFQCPDTPPARLRVGDEVSIIADGLWLRSEPRVDISTRVRQFLRHAPYRVHVVGGPVCEKYVFWQVEVGEFGEGGQTIQGWLAEGDLEEYYLVPVK